MSGVFAQLFEVLERAYDRPFDGDNVNTARFTKATGPNAAAG